MLETAAKSPSQYDYIHLISGGDVPIKSWDHIYHFFYRHKGEEFLSYGQLGNQHELFHRCGAFHFLQDICGRNHKILRGIDRGLFRFQKTIGINRIKDSNIDWYKGSNWFSITGNCACLILTKKKWIEKHFKYGFCCDELMVNTIVANSKYNKKVYLGGKSDDTSQRSSLRYVDWNRGVGSSPHTFVKKDLDVLFSAEEDLLFARKFDEAIDDEIIGILYDRYGDSKMYEEKA